MRLQKTKYITIIFFLIILSCFSLFLQWFRLHNLYKLQSKTTTTITTTTTFNQSENNNSSTILNHQSSLLLFFDGTNNNNNNNITSASLFTDKVENDTTIIINQLSKIWQPQINPYTWCTSQQRRRQQQESIIANNNNNNNNYNAKNQGLFYVKIPKAASSTGAGITIQVAKNVAQRLHYYNNNNNNKTTTTINSSTTNNNNNDNNDVSCPFHAKHGGEFKRRNVSSSILWTMIRNPASRCISQYFFTQIGRNGKNVTNHDMIQALEQSKGMQLNYIGPRQFSSKNQNNNNIKNLQQQNVVIDNIIQNQIMKNFQFIGLVERMEESLVVLQILMNLQDYDMIVLSSKQSGGYDDGGGGGGNSRGKCTFIPKSFTTPQVDNYIETNYKHNNIDYLLYDIVNKSLDLTIDYIGKEYVQETLKRHIQNKDKATKQCMSHAIYPCSKNGIIQPKSKYNCLSGDAGCGYQCVKNVLST